MEPNLAVSIYVRSSIKFLHFVPFHQQIWPPRSILVSDWLRFKRIFSSEIAWQNGANLGRKYLCKIFYKASSFGSIRPTNIATKINSFFWLANVKKKSSPLKQLGQMEPNLAGSIYVRSKPGIDGPWVCPFQNCVRQPHPPFKMVLFFKVMIIYLWNLLQYHSIVRWAIQAQWAEPLVSFGDHLINILRKVNRLIYAFKIN